MKQKMDCMHVSELGNGSQDERASNDSVGGARFPGGRGGLLLAERQKNGFTDVMVDYLTHAHPEGFRESFELSSFFEEWWSVPFVFLAGLLPVVVFLDPFRWSVFSGEAGTDSSIPNLIPVFLLLPNPRFNYSSGPQKSAACKVMS
ncbi:MAG: hypothetical protein ACF8AM_09975 [Rhodopirellula sp. JB055]|uniref:hypothetical protein n=1 Tax=Rhodopirellula sp. JB055 TaxID=3342846 RepID=UPI00370B9D99